MKLAMMKLEKVKLCKFSVWNCFCKLVLLLLLLVLLLLLLLLLLLNLVLFSEAMILKLI